MNPMAESRKLSYPAGTRVKLIRCNDPYTRLQRGEKGTVSLVDDVGTVHVKWDSGSSLGVCFEDGDRIEVVSRPG